MRVLYLYRAMGLLNRDGGVRGEPVESRRGRIRQAVETVLREADAWDETLARQIASRLMIVFDCGIYKE